MKRTTYVMIALMAGGFVLMAVLLLGVALLGNGNLGKQKVFFTGERAERTLPSCRVLVLEETPVPDSLGGDDEIHFFRQADFNLRLRPAPEGEGGKLSLPAGADSCLTVATAGDTLRLTLDPYTPQVAEAIRKRQDVMLVQDDWELCLPRGLECIKGDIGAQRILLRRLDEDSLCVQVAATLAVDSCRLGALRVEHVSNGLQLGSGTCRRLYLDTDGVRNWNVLSDDFRADSVYMAGHECHAILDDRAFGQVFWLPKDGDARLEVTLKQPGRIVLDE